MGVSENRAPLNLATLNSRILLSLIRTPQIRYPLILGNSHAFLVRVFGLKAFGFRMVGTYRLETKSKSMKA